MEDWISKSQLRIATSQDVVLHSECAFTFHTPFTGDEGSKTEGGILVNLQTFLGTVEELAGEGLFLRIIKRRVEKNTNPMDKVISAPKTLGIGVDGGFESEDDRYEIITSYSLVARSKISEDGTIQTVEECIYDDSFKTNKQGVYPDTLFSCIESIQNHSGMALQQDLEVWKLEEEPLPISKYAYNLPIVENGKTISPNPTDWRCESSGETENLWLNLSDGYIGGGRRNWDGTGGSNGALDHYIETGKLYPLVVKLGTITANIDDADCYSYAPDEDGPVKIPNLDDLLRKRGIHVTDMHKTSKSTAELEVELNATFAFDAITEAGANLIPVSGATLQGLDNLGNSCYMNSIVQLLLSGTIPELAKRYGCPAGGSVTRHPLLNGISAREAIHDVLCQTAKLSLALTSGAFSIPDSVLKDDSQIDRKLDPKYRIQPRMFKHVIAGNHVDFRTGQQQDAAQYLLYLLDRLDRAELGGKERLGCTDAITASSHLFSFRLMHRYVCSVDQKIKYLESNTEPMLSLVIPMEKATTKQSEPDQKRPKVVESSAMNNSDENAVPTISIDTCLESWAAEVQVQDYRWPHLNNTVAPALSQCRFVNFPRYLLLHMQRYTLGADWSPQKLEVALEIPQKLDLTPWKLTEAIEGENILVDDKEELKSHSSVKVVPVIDEMAVSQLTDMGFSWNASQRALTAVGGSDLEAAMNWVLEHFEDPDLNDPLPEPTSNNPPEEETGESIDENLVMTLVENLGCFTTDQVRAALRHTHGSFDRAADWLFSHMEDLDTAIASLSVTTPTPTGPTQPPAPTTRIPLEDGEGKYTMIGMVSHIGKNTGSGHYVAHLKRTHGDESQWVIFNDDKVAISAHPPLEHAYIYLFQRDDCVGTLHPHF